MSLHKSDSSGESYTKVPHSKPGNVGHRSSETCCSGMPVLFLKVEWNCCSPHPIEFIQLAFCLWICFMFMWLHPTGLLCINTLLYQIGHRIHPLSIIFLMPLDIESSHYFHYAIRHRIHQLCH